MLKGERRRRRQLKYNHARLAWLFYRSVVDHAAKRCERNDSARRRSVEYFPRNRTEHTLTRRGVKKKKNGYAYARLVIVGKWWNEKKRKKNAEWRCIFYLIL